MSGNPQETSTNTTLENSPTHPAQKRLTKKRSVRQLFYRGISIYLKQYNEDLDYRALMGSYCIQDAFEGRLENGLAEMSKKSPLIFKAFKFHVDDNWQRVVLIINAIHTLLSFLELDNEFNEIFLWRIPLSTILFVFNIIAVLIYLVDVFVKLAYQSFKTFVSKPWQRLYMISSILMAIDAVSFRSVIIASLRPTVTMFRARSVRRFFEVVWKMFPGFVSISIPLVFFLILSSSFGNFVFGDSVKILQSPLDALNEFWVLIMTGENYSDLLPEDASRPHIFFFFIVLAIGNLFLASLLLGVTFDVFLENTKNQTDSERLKEIKGLVKAFTIMDPEKTGTLDQVVWERCLRNLGYTKQQAAMYFQIASNFTDTLDIISFLDLRQILSYRFIEMTSSALSQLATQPKLPLAIESPVYYFFYHLFNRLMWLTVLTDLFVLYLDPLQKSKINAIVIITYISGIIFEIGTQFKGNFDKFIKQASTHDKIFIYSLFCSIFFHEFCITNISGLLGDHGVHLLSCAHYLSFVGRLMRTWKIVTLSEILNTYVSCFVHILPVFGQTLSFGLIIAYFFGMVGHSLFGSKIEYFTNPRQSMLTMMQLFFVVDFSQVAKNTVEVYSWASPYFFIYFIGGVVVIFNLINTIIIEMYTSTMNEKSLDAIKQEEEQDKRIAEKLTSKEVIKRVLKQWGSTVAKIQNFKLERIDSKAIRQKLSSDSQSQVSLKELKKCQKYAQVNLTEYYMDKYEGEGQIVTVQHDLSHMIIESRKYTIEKFTDGEYIIRKGETGSCCYLIQQGTCKVFTTNSEVVTKKDGDLLGEIALLSDTVRSADVVAVGDVECYCLTRQAFLTQFDQEVVVNLAEKIASIVATYNKHSIRKVTDTEGVDSIEFTSPRSKRAKSILI